MSDLSDALRHEFTFGVKRFPYNRRQLLFFCLGVIGYYFLF